MKKYKCKKCGKEFIKVHLAQKYCKDCGYTKVNLKPIKTKICPTCNKEFKTNPYALKEAIYCSEACYHKSDKARKAKLENYNFKKDIYNARRRKEQKQKQCLNCNKIFYTTKEIQKFCCKKCRKQYWYKQNKDYTKKLWIQKELELEAKGIKFKPTNKKWTKYELNKLEKLMQNNYKIVDLMRELKRRYSSIMHGIQTIRGNYIAYKFNKKYSKDMKETDIFNRDVNYIQEW